MSPTERRSLEDEFQQVKARLDTNKQLVLQLRVVEGLSSGIDLAKVRVGIEQTEAQIREDERRLDELQAEIEAAAQSGPGPEPEFARLPFEPETILIPAGAFVMGSPPGEGVADDETPPHTVTLPAFRIGRYPVTQRQYAAFIRDETLQAAPHDWFNRQPPPDRLDHPLTDVSWYEAMAYCSWLSKQTGRRYSLPSEAEWEKACSNDFSRSSLPETTEVVTTSKYPWGSEWAEERCNAGGSGTAAVMAHPSGASAYGVEDLLGNVQQWTRSLWGTEVLRPDFVYPYRPEDGREVFDPRKLPAPMRMVHRGGSYKSPPDELRSTAHGSALADSEIAWRGFRVVMMIDEH